MILSFKDVLNNIKSFDAFSIKEAKARIEKDIVIRFVEIYNKEALTFGDENRANKEIVNKFWAEVRELAFNEDMPCVYFNILDKKLVRIAPRKNYRTFDLRMLEDNTTNSNDFKSAIIYFGKSMNYLYRIATACAEGAFNWMAVLPDAEYNSELPTDSIAAVLTSAFNDQLDVIHLNEPKLSRRYLETIHRDNKYKKGLHSTYAAYLDEYAAYLNEHSGGCTAEEMAVVIGRIIAERKAPLEYLGDYKFKEEPPSKYGQI